MGVYRTRVNEKPLRDATDTFKLNDRGEFYNGFVWNSVCYAGSKTFPNSKEGLYFSLFEFFCEELPVGNTVFGDSRFCSPKILAWGKKEFGLRMAFTFNSTPFIHFFSVF